MGSTRLSRPVKLLDSGKVSKPLLDDTISVWVTIWPFAVVPLRLIMPVPLSEIE